METRTCQNCKNDFTIEPDDFSFYEKIGVPAPTFCPECRMVRRLVWRNERSLNKRQCGLCSKSIISMYSDTAPVYCMECWSSDGWNQYQNAKDYDFSKNFFSQLEELFSVNPRLYSYKFGSFVNSEYVNYAKDNKNCYLSFSVIDCEDVSYSQLIDSSRNSLDCLNVIKLDNCYENINCEGNYNTFFALNSQTCVDSWFLFDCVNCSDCFMSSNLRNQKYVFRNKKLSKEEYFAEMEKLNLNSFESVRALQEEYTHLIESDSLHKYAFTYAAEKSSGNYIHHVKNVKSSFDVYDSENISYSFRVLHAKDSMDNSGCGYGELIYESMAATMNSFKDSFCYITIQGCRECEYSLIMKNCSDCFGCVGLTNAQYCILNKQYTKEEYFALVEKIKEHMGKMPYIDRNGSQYVYGEYFPIEMSPFGYNETNAQDLFPIKKNEALEKKYNWRYKEKREYNITCNFTDIPDMIGDVSDSIVEEILGCSNSGDEDGQCTTAFKVTKEELQFYRQKNLPLPRFCPNCRHAKRLEKRNPLKLWHRTCMCDQDGHEHTGTCPNEFETSYAPDRPENVYCESCYQKEVL